MTQPFEAPEHDAPGSSSTTSLMVLLAWMLSGVTLGTAVGLTAESLDLVDRIMAPMGVGTGLVFAGIGQMVWMFERAYAENHRPLLADHRGVMRRPVHAGVFVLPAMVALPSLLWLAAIGTAATESVVVGAIFACGAAGVLVALREVWSEHRMAVALESLAEGRSMEAIQRLSWVEASFFVASRGTRNSARLNLAVLSLQQNDLEGARQWYSKVDEKTIARAFADVGLALVAVLQGRYEDAEANLVDAGHRQGSRIIQGQSSEVRLLLVLRRDGPQAAAELGERLLDHDAGPLLMGVLAAARHRAGDVRGAHELLGAEWAEHIRGSALFGVVPELQEAVAA